MRLRKIIFFSCLCLATVLFIDGISVLARINMKNPSVEPEGNEITRIQETRREPDQEIRQETPKVKKQPLNILIFGLDEEEERSDVMMLVNYSPEGGKINVLSIARDTRVKFKNRYEKINALFAIGGEKLANKAIEQMTGLNINYYITLNFKAFRKIIDVLDGVEFEVPFEMNYDDPDQNLHIHLHKGKQILSGDKAEQLVRYRKGNRSNQGYADGDIGRIKMQQEFLRAFLDQKLKIKYISKADDIFLIIKKYLKTNIEMADINKYLIDIKNIRKENIKMYTMPGDSAYLGNLWYFICDKKAMKELIDNNFYK